MSHISHLKSLILTGMTATLILFATQTISAADNTEESTPKATQRYVDLRYNKPITGNIAAGKEKSEVCAACHYGEDGIPIAPNIPTLLGQRADFIYWQMIAFQRGTLVNSPMTPLSADLTDEDIRDISAYFASLEPTTVAMTAYYTDITELDMDVLARGEELFLFGDASKAIPACLGCHGVDAGGHPEPLTTDRDGHTPYAAYPSLRGQQSIYLQLKLSEYRRGDFHDSTNDFIMSGVAQTLDNESIDVLAAWLSTLPPLYTHETK